MNSRFFAICSFALLTACVSNQADKSSSGDFDDLSGKALLIQDVDTPVKQEMEQNNSGAQKYKNIDAPIGVISKEELARLYSEVLAENPEPYMIPEAKRRLADLTMDMGGSLPSTGDKVSLETISSSSKAKTISQLAGVPATTTVAEKASVYTSASTSARASTKNSPVNIAQYENIVAQYQQLLASNSDDVDKEQLYFQLSRAYILNDDIEKSLETLGKLLEEYPDSVYAGEANFRRGELYFSLADYSNAVRAYKRSLAEGEAASFYQQALFKNGWALYQLEKFPASLNSLFAFLDISFRQASEGVDFEGMKLSGESREMILDTLHAISLNFSSLDGVASIDEYFGQSGERSYEHLVYQNLADYYLGHKRITDAASTYQAYIDKFPTYPKAVELSIWMVDFYKKNGFIRLAFESKKNLVNRYQIEGDNWKSIGEGSRQEILPPMRKYLQELSKHYHAKAQKSHKRKDHTLAAKWYRMYLHAFENEPEAAELNFLLAENLYESHEYGQAAIEYEKTAYHYTQHEKSVVAGYTALLSYKKVENTHRGDARDKWHRLRVSSALQYGASFPEDKNTPAVLMEAADDLFKSGDYKGAIKPARTVSVIETAKPSLRKVAFTILGHSEFELGNYANAETAYLALRNYIPAGNQAYADLEEKLAASIYKQGDAEYANGNFVKASKHFARVAQLAPKSSVRVTASYDSAAALIAAEEWESAINALIDFRAVYSSSMPAEMANSVRDKLIVAYLNVERPLDAVIEFETIAESSNDPEIIWSATSRIVGIYTTANKQDRVVETLKRYIRRAPKPFERSIEVRGQLADLYTEMGETDKRHYWLNKIIKTDRKNSNDSTDRTRFLAVSAAQELADHAYGRFAEVKLVAPLQASMKKKQRRMKAALDAYGLAADYGVAEATTSATYNIAEIYFEFFTALVASERPSNLSGEELEQYDILLEEEAYPFEDKAIEVHETNAARAIVGDYDEWVTKSFSQLAILRPARYAKTERGLGVSDAIH